MGSDSEGECVKKTSLRKCSRTSMEVSNLCNGAVVSVLCTVKKSVRAGCVCAGMQKDTEWGFKKLTMKRYSACDGVGTGAGGWERPHAPCGICGVGIFCNFLGQWMCEIRSGGRRARFRNLKTNHTCRDFASVANGTWLQRCRSPL